MENKFLMTIILESSKFSEDEVVEMGRKEEEEVFEILCKRFNGLKTLSDEIDRKYGIAYKSEKMAEYKYIDKSFFIKGLIKRYEVVPIIKSVGEYEIYMSDPFDLEKIEDIKIGLNTNKIKLTYMDIEALQFVINKILSGKGDSAERKSNGLVLKDSYTIDDSNESSVINFIERILEYSVKKGVSDIHIEPYKEFLQTRIRIDGYLEYLEDVDIKIHKLVLSRIKILCNMDIAKTKIPQEGHFKTRIEGISVDCRVSTIPTIFGEKAVIRILYNKSLHSDSKGLGFLEEDLKMIEEWVTSNKGLVLVTGSTGSGKSTTLSSFLNMIDTKVKNVVTVEDPVENIIENVTQVSLDEKIGLTFNNVLPYILRQDPDVLLIGEIRDLKTAEMGIKSSMTGHLVLSTLHTIDAKNTIIRLLDMGIENYLIASTLKGVVSQRLIRKICKNCKMKRKIKEEEKLMLGVFDIERVSYGKGCKKCNYTGYKGRTMIYEILEITEEVKKIILENTGEIKDIKSIKSYKSVLIEKIKKGETTVEEGQVLLMDIEKRYE